MPRIIARAAALIATAAAVFAMWVHLAILDPGNVGWLLRGQDLGQNALGLAAYLRDGAWPGTREPLLSAPEGLTLLFTDSNPLFGLLLWPLAGLMPPGLQFVGLWLLVCVGLHVLFAWALVRRFAPDFVTAWLGTVLLTLLPTLFNRLAHPNLCAHWLILWALWIFIDSGRARRSVWWAAVLGVAALVHAYLLVMVAAIWASALLAMLAVPQPMRDRAMLLACHAPVILLAVAIMALNGVFGGSFVSTGTFGAFPMALDALINPANPSYSALLPSTPDDQGRGFEGFQYLGAGLLMLVIAAGAILARTSPPARQREALHRLRWLLPAFAALTLIAIGNQILLQGQVVATLRLSPALIDLLDPLRASGRLFWPVAYTLVLVAILAAYRLGDGRALLLLSAALALQLIDIAPMLAAERTLTAAANDRRAYLRTRDRRWAAMIAGASAIEFHPPENFRDLQLSEEIGWRAVLACRPLRFFYASRMTRATAARLARDAQALRDGRIDPTRLYVLFDPAVVPAGLRGRVIVIDGVSVIAPAAPAPPPAC